jgi:hypothetical protein
MKLIGFILMLIGILYIILGSWEASIINNKTHTFDDSHNNVVSVFIIMKVIFNIVWGIYSVILSLFFICKNRDTLDNNLNQNSYGCINFIIGIFGLVEYYNNNSNIIHPFKQVLFIEMIIFYSICSIIIIILLSYCCLFYYFFGHSIKII